MTEKPSADHLRDIKALHADYRRRRATANLTQREREWEAYMGMELRGEKEAAEKFARELNARRRT